jgi:hypothetical protein
VPPFVTDVWVPDPIVVTSPDFGDAASYTLSRTADLAVQWTSDGGGSTGDVSVAIRQITAISPDFASTSIVCTFPETANGGTIPAAALAYLTPSALLDAAPSGGTTMSVALSTSQTPPVTGWSIAVEVRVAVESGSVTVE